MNTKWAPSQGLLEMDAGERVNYPTEGNRIDAVRTGHATKTRIAVTKVSAKYANRTREGFCAGKSSIP